MWSVSYAPKMGLVAPSFQFQADGFAPAPSTIDGDTTALLFEWDQARCAVIRNVLSATLNHLFLPQ